MSWRLLSEYQDNASFLIESRAFMIPIAQE